MRRSYPKPPIFDITQLAEQITSLGIADFCGLSFDANELHLEFDDKKTKFIATETKKLDAAVAGYVYKPSFETIRALRKPLLDEADWRILRAEDANDPEALLALRVYRQALRDVTLQDAAKLEWPKKPWE
jgi:hypothetical protein